MKCEFSPYDIEKSENQSIILVTTGELFRGGTMYAI